MSTTYKEPNYRQGAGTGLPTHLVQLLQETDDDDCRDLLAASELLGILCRDHDVVKHVRSDGWGAREEKVVSRSMQLSAVMAKQPHSAGASKRIMSAANLLKKHGFLQIREQSNSGGGRVSVEFVLNLQIFATPDGIQQRWFSVYDPVFTALKARRFEKIAKPYEEKAPWIANQRFTTYDAYGRILDFRPGDVVDARAVAFLSNGETPDPRVEPLGDRVLIESPHQCRCKHCKCFWPADKPMYIAIDVDKLIQERNLARSKG